MPGRDRAQYLLRRHKNVITNKLAANIKRSRADVSKPVIVDYFENLRETLNGVPPENLFNYDEINLQDDPGQKKCYFVEERNILNEYVTLLNQQHQL